MSYFEEVRADRCRERWEAYLYDQYYGSERSLEPQPDTRRVFAQCEFCGEDIMEGDEYFDLCVPTNRKYHYVCTTCMDNAHHYDAECADED